MRLWALVRKEGLLLSRDLHALAVLFVMPALFLLLMAFALAEVNQNRLPPLDLVLELPQPDAESAFFDAALRAQLPDSRIQASGPASLAHIRLPAAFAQGLLSDESDPRQATTLVFPARTDALSRQRLRAAVEVGLAQTRLMAFLVDSGELDAELPLAERLALIQQRTRSQIAEQEVLASGDLAIQANASQHSVPAWLIFGMFFVMLPMANSFQREQQSGTLLRFRCLGLSLTQLALSKLLPYLGINLLQFALLLALGVWGLPLLGLGPLALPGSPWAYLLLALSLAAAACCLGLAIAALARSTEQALLLSGGLNLILAAIGGIMVPKSVMPEAMRQLAEVSPMSWALDAFLTLLVGQGDLSDISPYCIRLLLFAALVGCLGLLLFHRRLSETQWTTHS